MNKLATVAILGLAACTFVEAEELDVSSDVEYGKGGKNTTVDSGDETTTTTTTAKRGGKGGGKGGTTEPPPADTAFQSTLSERPYLLGNESGTDVRAAVTGGSTPYTCHIYSGPGAGTVPLGVQQDGSDSSGCTLTGGVTEWDHPGAYGFTVVVTDAAGATVDVPVVYEGAPCDTGTVDVMPAPAPVLVAPAGEAQTWSIQVTDVDAVITGGVCDTCMTLNVLTRGPLSNAPSMDCGQSGDLCVGCRDCDTELTSACPASPAETAVRTIELRTHEPIRSGPAWATVGIGMNYSGASLSPCGGKRWQCHIEVLEL